MSARGPADTVPHIPTLSGERYDSVLDLEQLRKAHVPMHTVRTDLTADGNTVAALAMLQMWRAPLFAGFPITPSTKWLETIAAHLSTSQRGLRRLKLLEAEHAVADYMAGAAGACRDLIVSTATSSVGLDHMTETTRSLGASGLGNIVLVNVYRSTANYPLCIEGDPSDALAHRDDGFIQLACRGKQQIYDTMIQAPCLSMQHDVLTPVMPGYYGIKDSHRNARLTVEPDAEIHAFQDRWIKPCPLPGLINGDTAMGNCVTSKHFQGFKHDQKQRILRVFDWMPRIAADFERTFGRPGLEFFDLAGWPDEGDVDLAVVTMGPDFGTFEWLREEWAAQAGMKVAGLAIRLLNPLPRAALRARVERAKVVLVVNQAHHSGRGHLTLDVADAIAGLERPPILVSAFCGMGGADVSQPTWEAMLEQGALAHRGLPYADGRIYHEGTAL